MQMPWNRLPGFVSDALADSRRDEIYEIRVRLSQRIEICRENSSVLVGERITEDMMTELIASLTGHSVYACEEQMREGFFTLPGGARVGVAGRYASDDGELQSVSSVSIRIPRAVSSDSETAVKHLLCENGIKSCLILSQPRMGKTTLLRAIVQKLSQAGFHVAVADERDELSAGESLGERVDVIANCQKRIAIPRLVRSMSPEIVATDEIGHSDDSEIIADARRCGCAVIATAHASDIESARRRKKLGAIIESGVFDVFIELGLAAGHIVRILDKEGKALWTDGR